MKYNINIRGNKICGLMQFGLNFHSIQFLKFLIKNAIALGFEWDTIPHHSGESNRDLRIRLQSALQKIQQNN